MRRKEEVEVEGDGGLVGLDAGEVKGRRGRGSAKSDIVCFCDS